MVTDGGVVVQIAVDALAETSEAIHIGDTYGDVVKTYPQVGPVGREAPGEIQFNAPGGDGNQYRITFETLHGSLDVRDPRPASAVNVIGLSLLAPSQVGEDFCRFVS